MTDVYIVTLSTVLVLLSSTGMAAMLGALLPGISGRAYVRLRHTPAACLWLGLAVFGPLVIATLVLLSIPVSAVQLFGAVVGVLALGIKALGAAGLARLLAERLPQGGKLSGALRGAFLVNLACLAPFVGWFLVFPLVASAMTGAAIFALLGWQPRRTFEAAEDTAATQVGI